MALPVGVTTCTYHAGPAVSVFGSSAKVSATIKPVFGGGVKRLIHQATGTVLADFTETVPEDDDGIVQFALPHVDQDGFVDPAGNAVTMWSYDVSVKVARTGGAKDSVTYTQTLQPLVGDTEVDLDLVPSDGTAVPVVPVATSLSVVNHGDNPNLPRPLATVVIWAGTAEPVNADTDYDLWVGPEGA